jgi:prolyl 4-hydroxylase
MQATSPARQAVALAAQGRIAEALRLLDESAAAGDGEAAFALGLWRLEGRMVRRDVAGARADIARGAEAGHRDASRVYAGFLATGTGGPRDWAGALKRLDGDSDKDPLAARQRELIATMAIDVDGAPLHVPAREPVSDAPRITWIRALFTPDECAFLAELASPRFRPAVIFHEGQQRFVRDPVRESDAAGFPVVSEWPFVHALNRRIATATGTAFEQGEPLQVLRYGPGQQYKPHLDALPGLANQRRWTALIYLNDDYEGGETAFLETGHVLRGRSGDMLLFENALADGRPDPTTRHAGRPVTAGTKLLASRWIRERPADPATGFGQHEAVPRG